MYVNGNVIGSAAHDSSYSLLGQSSPVNLQSTLILQEGEQIWLQFEGGSSIVLTDTHNHYTHFMGWLLEEDISKSL